MIRGSKAEGFEGERLIAVRLKVEKREQAGSVKSSDALRVTQRNEQQRGGRKRGNLRREYT